MLRFVRTQPFVAGRPDCSKVLLRGQNGTLCSEKLAKRACDVCTAVRSSNYLVHILVEVEAQAAELTGT
jgi:hypothetical protein